MNLIKEVLEERGISQTWLAKQLGKSFCMVNGYACNRTQPPLDVLYKIAEILEISPKELLQEPKKQKKYHSHRISDEITYSTAARKE